MVEIDNSVVTILVVEDESALALLLKAILRRDGYRVEMAGNGVEGVARAKELKPDMILMDLVMPEMDGYEATRLIKADPELADIPIAILSGKPADEDGGRAFAEGGMIFVRKPFEERQIRDLVSLTLQSTRV